MTTLACGASGACRTPTEVTIEIASDVGFRADMSVAIAIDAPEKVETAPPRVVVREPWPAGGTLGTVVALPSGDRDDFVVRVALATGRDPSACTAADATGCVVVRRRVRFVRGESTRARVVLRPACVGAFCDATSSCAADGACGSLDTDEASGDAAAPAPVSVDASDPYGKAVLEDRPRHYYRLDEPPGATVARDATGRANGAYAPSVKLGVTGALESSTDTGAFFDGTGGVTVERAEDLPGASSIEAWIRSDAFNEDVPAAIVERVDVVGDASFGFRLSKPKDKAAAFAVFRGTRSFETSAALFRFAGYHHVVAVTRGTDIEIYVDGRSAATAPLSDVPPSPVLGPLLLGATRSGAVPFRGAIDEVAIYDYPLEASQIARHYAASTKK
jgi:hypothetical protein